MSEQLKQAAELQAMSLNDLASEVERARATKANLEALKAKNAKTFTRYKKTR